MHTIVLVYYRCFSKKCYRVRPHVSQLSLPAKLLSSLNPNQLKIYLCGYVGCCLDDFLSYQIVPMATYPLVWGKNYDN